MAEIPDASEVRSSLDDKVNSEADELEDKVASELESAKGEWGEGTKDVYASGYSDEAKRKVDERLASKNYSSRVDGDYIKIEKP